MLQMMKFQIGKGGISEGTIASLRNALKTHKVVRVSVLKSAAPTKAKVLEMAQELKAKLIAVNTRVVGFTIIVRRIKLVEKS